MWGNINSIYFLNISYDQEHIQGLEQDWHKMPDAKFLSVVKAFECADKKNQAEGKKKKASLQKKRKEESESDDGKMAIVLRTAARGGVASSKLLLYYVKTRTICCALDVWKEIDLIYFMDGKVKSRKGNGTAQTESM